MENFPLQMVLFGMANTVMEPFCYGCAGFILSYRLAHSTLTKILFISITILCFFWMDDIWPAMASRSAKMAGSSENRNVSEFFKDRKQVGRAKFYSGEKSGLWDFYKFDAWDVVSAIIFVPLGFYVSLVLTKKRHNKLASQNVAPPPPPGRGRTIPPPPPI